MSDLPVKKDVRNPAHWPVQGAEVLQRVADIVAAEPVQRPIQATEAGGLADVVALAESALARIVDEQGAGREPDAIEVQRWQRILADAKEEQAAEPREHTERLWDWLDGHKNEEAVLMAYTFDDLEPEQRIAGVRKAIIECALGYALAEERARTGVSERGPLLRDPRQVRP